MVKTSMSCGTATPKKSSANRRTSMKIMRRLLGRKKDPEEEDFNLDSVSATHVSTGTSPRRRPNSVYEAGFSSPQNPRFFNQRYPLEWVNSQSSPLRTKRVCMTD
uniref:Uncharacterized protein n=1 Tax=Bursaphelenchus xylophilus TaxID=6326 RepID=A0A1I7RRP1_BURXY